MKGTITELGNLCKMAAVLEQKWDQAGRDYLETKMKSIEYTDLLEEYLRSVRLLEVALSNHLLAVTTEIAQTRTIRKSNHNKQNHRSRAS